MNSINIISSHVSASSSPSRSRSNSHENLVCMDAPTPRTFNDKSEFTAPSSSALGSEKTDGTSIAPLAAASTDKRAFVADKPSRRNPRDPPQEAAAEETPLLAPADDRPVTVANIRSSPWHNLPRRVTAAVIASLRFLLSTIAAPGVYLWACLCDESGTFSPLATARKWFGGARSTSKTTQAMGDSADVSRSEKDRRQMQPSLQASALSRDLETPQIFVDSAERVPTGKGMQGASLEVAAPRRSIRIKLNESEGLLQRKHRRTASSASSADSISGGDISAQLKSPTSPAAGLTKYPKAPVPPRPLVPRRQPSYINQEPPTREGQKTLILDLDETLIHSISRATMVGTGHMVEVRLSTPHIGPSGQVTLGPQHPILYVVHKRPHCDEFLRRVHKWYNLVVFTASVQEYADPVIDWLESDKKYFSKRYYRQHCTFRHGAFVKDLSFIEPDLSKVIILDNSPLSYMFHQDNAIPIQGWISDPTDNDLQHLVPLLEGLQYVSDVRAILALRAGEYGQQ